MEDAAAKESNAKIVKVTEERVTAALKADKGEGAKLLSWKIKDFTKKGDNYACIVTSIEVQYMLDNKQHETTYVAKITRDLPPSPFQDMITPIFLREGTCLSKVVPEMNRVLNRIGLRNTG